MSRLIPDAVALLVIIGATAGAQTASRVTRVEGGGHVIQVLLGTDDNAPIHVMLTSQTRGEAGGSSYAYTCWNCTRNRVEQLHVMLMLPMRKMYPVPGGILHMVWQKSRGTARES